MFRGTISREEWGAAPPTQNAGGQAYNQGMILHWEGPKMWGDLWSFAHSSCYEKVRGIQRYHMNVGYSDIAYNDVICPHGYIFSGRSGVGMANAASGNWDVNHETEAVCFLWGEGDDQVCDGNPDPGDALNALRNFLIWQAGMSWEVRPHRSIVQTSCPGDSLATVAGWLNGAPPQPFNSSDSTTSTPPPATPPPVVEQPAPEHRVLGIGDSGFDVAEWQSWLNNNANANLVVDGDFGPATQAAVMTFQSFWKQYNPMIDVDGIIGPQTWDLRNFVEYLKAQPPAPAPAPAPAPEPEPEPAPVRVFTDSEIATILALVEQGLGWDFVGKRRQAKLDKITTLLTELTE